MLDSWRRQVGWLPWGKLISLLIAIFYLVGAYAVGGGWQVIWWLVYLLLPLACIWFGDEMGCFIGTFRGPAITQESSGCFVRFMGWVLLLLPLMMGIINTLRSSD